MGLTSPPSSSSPSPCPHHRARCPAAAPAPPTAAAAPWCCWYWCCCCRWRCVICKETRFYFFSRPRKKRKRKKAQSQYNHSVDCTPQSTLYQGHVPGLCEWARSVDCTMRWNSGLSGVNPPPTSTEGCRMCRRRSTFSSLACWWLGVVVVGWFVCLVCLLCPCVGVGMCIPFIHSSKTYFNV